MLGGGCFPGLEEYDPCAETLVFLGTPLGGAAGCSGLPQAGGQG